MERGKEGEKENGHDKQSELRVWPSDISVAPFGLDLELMSRWRGSLKLRIDRRWKGHTIAPPPTAPTSSPVIKQAAAHVQNIHITIQRAEREATESDALQKLETFVEIDVTYEKTQDPSPEKCACVCVFFNDS